ncbi:hypothetical protein ES703_118030 [subsurface metagenome]
MLRRLFYGFSQQVETFLYLAGLYQVPGKVITDSCVIGICLEGFFSILYCLGETSLSPADSSQLVVGRIVLPPFEDFFVPLFGLVELSGFTEDSRKRIDNKGAGRVFFHYFPGEFDGIIIEKTNCLLNSSSVSGGVGPGEELRQVVGGIGWPGCGRLPCLVVFALTHVDIVPSKGNFPKLFSRKILKILKRWPRYSTNPSRDLILQKIDSGSAISSKSALIPVSFSAGICHISSENSSPLILLTLGAVNNLLKYGLTGFSGYSSF